MIVIVRVSVVIKRNVVFLSLKMTSAQVVDTSVIVNNNSSFQNY